MMTRTPENRQQKFLKILQVFQGRTKAAIAIKMKQHLYASVYCRLYFNLACSSYFLYSFGASKTFVVWQIIEDVEATFRAWRPFCSRGVFFFLGFKLREQRVLTHAGCHLSLQFNMSI